MSRGYLTNPRGPFICQNPLCGKTYFTTRGPGEGETYCSRGCCHAYKAQTKKPPRIKKRCPCGTIAQGQLCRKCRRVVQLKARQESMAESRKRRAENVRKCVACKAEFTPKLSFGRIGKYCLVCRAISDRIERLGVAYETVNSLSVFSRDGWLCQHCKCDTPQSLVGTLEHNAPTLDHILPLSHGGAHSYFNSQCTCRKCNSHKGNRLAREPRLKGVVDLQPYRVAKYPSKHGRAKQPRTCTCGCGKRYTPYVDGNDMYANGHWQRVAHSTTAAGHSPQYSNVVAYVKARIWTDMSMPAVTSQLSNGDVVHT